MRNENMKRYIALLFILLLPATLTLMAQPKARAARQAAEKQNESQLSVRAQNSYPRAEKLPQDVPWMREIYRTLDLSKAPNGALYHPVEPVAGRMNLFTTIFKLLTENKIQAYEYMLDGTERLTPDYRVEFKDVLERFQIYYEQRRAETSRDSILVVDPADVPSAEVLSYFIKEVWYFDRNTSTFGSKITAICPIMHRAEEFSYEALKLPMFWIDYADLAPYLTQAAIMTSDLNNAANRNMDDFFVSRLYKGDIYKTTNMMNRTLAQYCETDSALVKEQQRIEDELLLFEKQLYGQETAATTEQTDSLATQKPTKKTATQTNTKRQRNAESVSKPAKSTQKESAAPKASVRRQRR